MSALTKPIPALYTVYILRSTVRRASLYIGSTPNPPRRLKQHNGLVKGGAARTSRHSLRPWEMVGLVSGFPGMMAALKFEWALTNPHLSLHIPSSSRLTISTQYTKSGRPRRPRQSLALLLANLHLLLRVPSFTRWPLNLHFFARDVHDAWVKGDETAEVQLRDTLRVHTDFGPEASRSGTLAQRIAESQTNRAESWGIHALPLDYTPHRPFLAKARSIFEFEREGDCTICHKAMPSGGGLYAVCSNDGCEAVGHLDCWSRHFLAGEGKKEEEGGVIVPVLGTCPCCGGSLRWVDMMTELSLRVRGSKEVDKILKAKRGEKVNQTAD